MKSTRCLGLLSALALLALPLPALADTSPPSGGFSLEKLLAHPQTAGTDPMDKRLSDLAIGSTEQDVPTQADGFAIKRSTSVSLRDALLLGLDRNRDLLAARQALASAQAASRKTRAQLFPTLSLSAGANTGVASASVLATPAGVNPYGPPIWTVDPGLTLAYDFGTDGGKYAQIDMSDAQMQVSALEVRRQELTLRQTIASAYYDVQAGDQQVRITTNDVENARKSLRDTQVLKQAGISTVFEIQRAEVQLARTQSSLVNAQSQQLVARRTLVQLLGLGFGTQVLASDPVAVAGHWKKPLNETILATVKRRPEVEEAHIQEIIATASRRLAASTAGPRLSVSAGTDALTLPGAAVGYNGGVSVSMPLYEGGAARAGVDGAEADLAGARIKYANAVAQLQLQVEQAYSQLDSSRANITTTSAALKEAQDSLGSARTRFQAGVGTQTDLIDAENDLSTADGNYITAVLSFNRALATLTALAGS